MNRKQQSDLKPSETEFLADDWITELFRDGMEAFRPEPVPSNDDDGDDDA